jgi:hypothetical protein
VLFPAVFVDIVVFVDAIVTIVFAVKLVVVEVFVESVRLGVTVKDVCAVLFVIVFVVATAIADAVVLMEIFVLVAPAIVLVTTAIVVLIFLLPFVVVVGVVVESLDVVLNLPAYVAPISTGAAVAAAAQAIANKSETLMSRKLPRVELCFSTPAARASADDGSFQEAPIT